MASRLCRTTKKKIRTMKQEKFTKRRKVGEDEKGKTNTNRKKRIDINVIRERNEALKKSRKS